MLQTRTADYRINPALYGGILPRMQESTLKMSEAVEFVGFLYETPQPRNPQEEALGWLVRVSGVKNIPNGVYSIEVRENENPSRVFASAARLVTGLPKREDPTFYPFFGKNEVALSEQTYDLNIQPKLRKKVDHCLRSANEGFKFVYV